MPFLVVTHAVPLVVTHAVPLVVTHGVPLVITHADPWWLLMLSYGKVQLLR